MKINVIKNDSFVLDLIGDANRINTVNYYPNNPLYSKLSLSNYESGIKLTVDDFALLAAYNYSGGTSWMKVNGDISYKNFNLKSENSLRINNFENSLPLFSKNDISYRNKFFKDKLDLKLGMNIKFIMNYEYYSKGYLTTIDDRFYSGSTSQVTDFSNFNNKFLADFYIGARIGRANINFTVANIFNSFYYDTFMFPSDDRGGLGMLFQDLR